MNRITGFLLVAALQVAPLVAGDPSAGDSRGRPAIQPTQLASCRACHSLKPGESPRAGPNLWGIAGRPAASRQDYSYSAALRRSDIVWDARSLDSFLADPQRAVPGTRMAFGGIADPARRAAAVAELLALGSPRPSP